MRTVAVQLRADDEIGTTDRRLFGAFIEHLGRCVYGGIFEPGHSTADSLGFRGDVLALAADLRERAYLSRARHRRRSLPTAPQSRSPRCASRGTCWRRARVYQAVMSETGWKAAQIARGGFPSALARDPGSLRGQEPSCCGAGSVCLGAASTSFSLR
jgi:hypothetical protein